MPRDIETTPPSEAQYTVEPPQPPLHQPCDVNTMIRPPRPTVGRFRLPTMTAAM